MREIGADERLERSRQLMHLLGRKGQPEQLDGHQLVEFGLVRTKYRAKRTRRDLMHHTVWSERVGWRRAG
jgi:hypothetical protein